MDRAKPGDIKNHCNPNAVSTFMEYLMDYASYETRLIGENLIEDVIDSMHGIARERAINLLEKVKKGKPRHVLLKKKSKEDEDKSPFGSTPLRKREL